MTMTTPDLSPDFATALEPLADRSAGMDLDGTFELSALEVAVSEPEASPIAGVEWEDTRDWREIERQARVLLTSSKDLRVAVQLARAALHQQGLEGFCEAVRFVSALAQRYWENIYPRLELETGEPTARINALEELASRPFLDQLRKTSLGHARGVGPVSIKEALGTTQGATASSEPAAHVLAALDALGSERLDKRLDLLRTTREAVHQLRLFVQQQSAVALRLQPLSAPQGERPGLLDAVETLLLAARQRMREVSEPVELGALADPLPEVRSKAHSGSVTSRDDVVAMLELVCDYYQTSEPASPVPLLLRRAQRLVPLDFVALVQELARDGLPGLAMIAGLNDLAIPEAQSLSHDDIE